MGLLFYTLNGASLLGNPKIHPRRKPAIRPRRKRTRPTHSILPKQENGCLPAMPKRNLRRSRRSPKNTMDKHLRQHNYDKLPSERAPTSTTPSLQQTHRNARLFAQNIRKNIPNNLPSHAKLLRKNPKESRRTAKEPTPTININENIQTLGRNHVSPLHQRQRPHRQETPRA